MNSQMVLFNEVITREEFKSGDLNVGTREDLKAYFYWVKERYDSGEQYPYDLEELVGVVYTTKVDAVRAIEKSCQQLIDYTVKSSVADDVTAFGGKRTVKQYRLTPLAFEFIVARQSKPVFEIYHKIFHAVMEQKQVPKNEVQPTTPAQMFVLVAQQFLEYEQRLLGMETKQQKLEDRVNEALPRDNYITVMGFCAKYNLKFTTEEKRLLGMDASKLCRERKVMIDSVPDKRYGQVHAYPEDVLVELCELN